MIWRPEQVESAIANSKRILGGAQVSANVSQLRVLFMLRSVLKARFNQDGAVLKTCSNRRCTRAGSICEKIL